MDQLWGVHASRLRERAARCRWLAQHAKSEGIAHELEFIAQDYAKDAEVLERLSHAEQARIGSNLTTVG
jgi:hypothetical protein